MEIERRNGGNMLRVNNEGAVFIEEERRWRRKLSEEIRC
jgi:hypothetical protein